MEDRDKKTELLVGLFLFVGLLLLGGLILKFSSVMELWKTTYEITVPFPDATGVKTGTPVVLGGSKIGKVPRAPVLNAQFNGVIVPLEIYNDKNIPIDAKFNIGTAGLLGDSYIEIRPSGKVTESYIPHGANLGPESVVHTGGLGALQDTANQVGKKADLVMDDLRAATNELKDALHRVSSGALSDKTLESFRNSMEHLESTMKHVDEDILGNDNKENLKKSLSELKDATTSFKSAAATLDGTVKKLGPLIDKIDPAVEKISTAMTTADEALKSFKQSGDNLAGITKTMAKGDGLFKALMVDPKLRDNFADLIDNLRRNGVLWYKDNADKLKAEQDQQRQEQQRRTVSPPRSRN